MKKEFSARHKEFYSEFDKWRKELSNKNVPTEGIYILKANKSISRFLEIDNGGILYIGKGDILGINNRIGKFINAINQTERKHSGGIRFNEKAKEKFPIDNCTVKIELNNDSLLRESQLLSKYKSEFGELPPLNRILT